MATKKNFKSPAEIIQEVKKLIQNREENVAINFLKQAQKDFPNEILFVNLLAQIALEKNNLTQGIDLLKKSLTINSNQSTTLYDLGIALTIDNQLEESINFLDKSLKLKPKNQNALIRKAINLNKLGKVNDAIDCYQKIIELNPNYIQAYIGKADLLSTTNKVDEIILIYKQALKIEPDNASLYIKYGNFLKKIEYFDESIYAYKKSIELKSNNPGALINLGNLYRRLNKYDEACFYFKESLKISDDYEVFNNIGEIYCILGKDKKGIEFYDKAIKFKPEDAEAHILKAYALQSIKQTDKAILSFENALNINKDYKYAFGEYFYTKNTICDWENFEENLKWIKLKLNENKCISVPLALCSFFDNPGMQKNCAQIYANDRFPYKNVLGELKKYKKKNKIRIGYFSGDFRDHPVGYLVTELFEMHDKSKFELFAFSLSKEIKSKIRSRIEKAFDEFIDVSGFEDKKVAIIAREKEIDIAIDLGGYTKNSRPEIFSMRAAPIQINFLGYPGTLGTNYIDYNIADQTVISQESIQYFSEKIIYLPKCYQPNEAKLTTGKKIFSRISEGLPEKGFVFCCFNGSWKITPKIFTLWVRILSKIDGSVLWFPGFPSLAIENLRNQCIKLGVDKNRLVFSSLEKYREDHQSKIKLADIFLDCFPFGAQSTASDFLRVGVPIVTLKGDSFPNRVASSLLIDLKLKELITTSELDYENLAIKLANDSKYLKEVKLKLISNIESSSIYNISDYTKSIESGYSQVYERYHNNLTPDNIKVI